MNVNHVVEAGVLRRTIAALFLAGSIGTGAELLLLEHTEGVSQTVPLILIAAGCLALCVVAVRPDTAGIRIFQLLMALFVLSGIAGIVLHVQGNAEFELELQPEAAGLELFWAVMKGATPALAPGTMMLLGGMGLVYTYRHPSVNAPPTRPG